MMRLLITLGMILLLAACSSSTDKEEAPALIVIDARGLPIKGALVMPEPVGRESADPTRLSHDEMLLRTSDAQGIVRADLEIYYWPNDGCFHFVATRPGYETATISVSKDLFPTPLKIKLDAVSDAANPKIAPGGPQRKAN